MKSPFCKQAVRLVVQSVLLVSGYLGQAQPKLTPAALGVICWQEGVKLRWKDFEAGSAAAVASLLDVRVGACSATEVAVLPYTDARGKGNFLVESFFVKNRSWVRDSASVFNRVVLAHEQVHFDINELFARKVRLVVAQYYEAGRYLFGPELSREIRRLLNEKTVFNAAFDQEAYRDPSGRAVDKWQALVGHELATLGAYKSNAATCGQ